MKVTSLLLILSFFTSLGVKAQSISFSDDEKERGYYNRPYKRYEAEPEKCQMQGAVFLAMSVDQKNVQSEASNQTAVQLTSPNSYVEWTNDEAADGLTIRFSLPDGDDGLGTKGNLALYVNGEFIRSLELDSYWAWQWFRKNDSNKYPDNTPSTTSFPRMRFDEMHVKLDKKIPANATFRLVKTDNNTIPYVIDFVELEAVPAAVTFESLTDQNKVKFEGGSLETFITNNAGKTIYIPAGKHSVSGRIYIRKDGTKLIGAGMWHTELFFTADPLNASTFSRRGIESNNNNIVIEGLYLNTKNNQRYLNADNSKQVGKAFMGSFGSNSVIRNVWAEHFECGAWIADYGSSTVFSDKLLVQHCRFRNNYADGINLCRGTKNAVVEYCSFRNNGDDDMASWSSSYLCQNNTFRYCTAENNWRASSLGLFGGENAYAHHLVIADGMESGVRINSDFEAKEGIGNNRFENISIYRCGSISGTPGEKGDLWGNTQPAFALATTTLFHLKDIQLSNIDIYDSRRDAIQISSSSSQKKFNNLTLNNITIDGTGNYGIYFKSPRGTGTYCNLIFKNIGASSDKSSYITSFAFTEDCQSSIPLILEESGIDLKVEDNSIIIYANDDILVSVYDLMGNRVYQMNEKENEIVVSNLNKGLYIVKLEDSSAALKVLVK